MQRNTLSKSNFVTWKKHGSVRQLCDCYISVTGKGEDSDVLSINADAYDSDIEGPCNEEDGPDVQENPVRSGASQIDDLQKDIEKSVNEILGLAESSPKEPKAATLAVPPSEDVQPSAQQLELLELEMRARAIKALMKAGDVKKQPWDCLDLFFSICCWRVWRLFSSVLGWVWHSSFKPGCVSWPVA